MESLFQLTNDIRSIIIVMDQQFGILNIDEENEMNQNLLGVELRSTTEQSLSEFHNRNINILLLVQETILPKDQVNKVKEFISYANDVISVGDDLETTFSKISEKAEYSPEQTLFVAADRVLRSIASDKSYTALPHISIASLSINKTAICFAKITGDEKLLQGIKDIIPYYLERYEKDQLMLLAITSYEAIAHVIARQLKVDILNYNFSIDDVMFVSLDHIDNTTKDKIMKLKIIFSDGKRILVSLPSSISNDSVPFHDKHGHFLFLSPDPTLLKPVSTLPDLLMAAETSSKKWPLKKAKLVPITDQENLLALSSTENPSQPSSIKSYIDRYTGISNLDNQGKIISRHCEHPDTRRVINRLVKDLRSMGYRPITYPFSYRNKNLLNVIADLPGRGYFKSEPDISENIRQVFLKYPSITPSDQWVREITDIVGKDWLIEQNLEGVSPLELRKKLNEIFFKNSAWWIKETSLEGLESQMIIVCGHLDSTANLESIYNQLVDPAPGTDDNCSGLAALLSIAKYLSQFRGKLTHTIRFCFFNAEEVGLHGSREYASYLKDKDTQIKAVINLDMMGFNNDENRTFEIHAGYTDPLIRDRCVPLAELIKRWSDKLGKVGPAQIYKGTLQGNDSDYDRDVYDGAIRRSDHYSFQSHGYPSIHISEDFFANLPVEPGKDRNPNYHRFADKRIDNTYVADIVNAAAFAIKELASK